MSGTPPSAVGEYSWHLSDVLLARPALLDEADEADSVDDVSRADAAAVPAAGELPPLWYRIVTGRSLAWRVRAVFNRLRWRRRRLARTALRWLDLHPEIRTSARTGGVSRVVAGAVLRRPQSTAVAVESPRAPVVLHGHLDLAASARSLVDTTAVTTSAEPTIEITAGDHGLVILRRSEGQPIGVIPPVDPTTWTPERFTTTPIGEPARISTLFETADDRPIRRRLQHAHTLPFVRCAADSVEDPIATARSVVELAVARVPLVGRLSEDTTRLVGDEVARIIAGVAPRALRDPAVRELHATELRRAALADHAAPGWWRRVGDLLDVEVATTPSVSVLLPSNRAEDILDAARRVVAQRGVDVQLVVGLHGAHMSDVLDAQLAEIAGDRLVVTHLDDALNLGQVMSALTERADGRLVSKWDDDDWYDAHHLVDLCDAMESSGATLIGKAAEFVYLEQLDVTMRRFATGSERFSTTIAGGTLLVRADDLDAVGWADAPRRVDRLMIEGIEARGGTVYRTHGFGYILRRRNAHLGQHTWSAGDEYFLSQAVDQRRGLAFDFAGFGSVS